MAIQKKYRLSPPYIIKNLIFSGKRYNFPLFNLIYQKNKTNKVRIVVLVSKKVDTKATIRNKIKRLVFSAFMDIQKTYKLLPIDFIVLTKRGLVDKKKDEIFNELYKALLKIDAIKNV